MASQPQMQESRQKPDWAAGWGFAWGYACRSAEVLAYWVPVWIPFILLAQIYSRGLLPALEEQRRLALHAGTLAERLDTDSARAGELDLTLEALDDEIYHERLLRLFRDDARATVQHNTLTLEFSNEDELPTATR